VYISTNLGGALAAANCDSTYFGDLIGYKDYGCGEDAYRAARARSPGGDQPDSSTLDRLVRREVFRYMGDHADQVPVVMAVRVGRALKVYGVGQEIEYDDLIHSQDRWVVYAGLVSWYVVAGLAVAGAVVVRRRREVPVFPLLVVPAVVLLAVAAIFAQTRYRAPAEPAVVILAAVAIDARLPGRRAGPAAEGGERRDEETATISPSPCEPPVGFGSRRDPAVPGSSASVTSNCNVTFWRPGGSSQLGSTPVRPSHNGVIGGQRCPIALFRAPSMPESPGSR
jgi:hypothetical protein